MDGPRSDCYNVYNGPEPLKRFLGSFKNLKPFLARGTDPSLPLYSYRNSTLIQLQKFYLVPCSYTAEKVHALYIMDFVVLN